MNPQCSLRAWRIDLPPRHCVSQGAAARLKLLDVDTTGDVYDRKLVLSRPGGHAAWRGDAPPAKAAEVIDQIRRAAPRRARQAA